MAIYPRKLIFGNCFRYEKNTYIVKISIDVHDDSKVGQMVAVANDLISIFIHYCAFIRGPLIRFNIPENALTIWNIKNTNVLPAIWKMVISVYMLLIWFQNFNCIRGLRIFCKSSFEAIEQSSESHETVAILFLVVSSMS